MATDSRPQAARRAAPGHTTARRLPPQLIAGAILVATSWPLAWFGPAPYSQHTFFPLWLGYILTVDGLVRLRTGTSLLSRGRLRFLGLFAASIPLWWLFEGANHFVQNWHYLSGFHAGPLERILESSLDFSTVVPAIFETAALYRSFAAFNRPICWFRIPLSRRGLALTALAGVAFTVIALAFPAQGFAYVWLALFVMLDPINALLGQRSIAGQLAHGRWDTVLVLFAAGITCGIFWEMWNFYSMPKWYYTVPYVGFLKVFEMPILGYGGYLPFSLEVYAIYQTLHWLVTRRPDQYVRFDRPDGAATRAA